MDPIEFGRYSLIRRIAQGGMAQIFLAVQRGPHGFEKVAVLKVILPELCTNDEFVKMFLDEARIAANLDHNNVVRVYDFGELNGQYYIAMEHLPGEDLSSVLQQSRRSSSPLPIDTVADIVLGAATGLHFAHELKDARGRLMNVVHRDVSPSNIIVTYPGNVKLVDFGIARAESNAVKTDAGTLKGKIAYVSPEQARGEALDRRSDVWALGTVLYELLTGLRLFRRDSDLATLKAVTEGPIASVRELRPDVPERLEQIVERALTRDIDLRYQTAAAMGDDLAAFLVSRGYVRSERVLAEFMSGLFDAERRDAKMTIARAAATDGPVLKTPSQLKGLPEHLSPLRSSPTGATRPLSVTPSSQRVAPRHSRWGFVAVAVALISIGLGVGVVSHTPAATPPPPPSSPPPAVVTPLPPPAEPLKTPAGPDGASKAPAEPPSAPDKAAKPKGVVAGKGRLTIDTSPWVEVYLNGKKLGDTPIVDLPLPAGVHVLKLVNEDKGLKSSIEVEIQPGKTTVKRLKL
jgi:serine/threonine-protein kinase